MGNLIKDFWTYQYKGKSYYGICEVVAGADLKQQRHTKRFETHIEKALSYTMKYDLVSHMSIQKYLTKAGDDVVRKDEEETFYPFFMEFEPKCSPEKATRNIFESQYREAAGEALRVVKYAINMLDVDERDILVMINNSRSIYVMFNPRTYGLRPSNRLHLIYKEMYRMIDAEIGLKYVDTSLYNSYGLMKTPNCYYKGGYFTKITPEHLEKLYFNPGIKQMLTSTKKSLDYYVPAISAPGLTDLYQEARENIVGSNKRKDNDNKQVTFISNCSAKCVEHIENHVMEEGSRNHALVSVGIFYKNKGYTKDQVASKVINLANSWGHDESQADIRSKVNTIFRYDYKFSCKFAKEALQLEMNEICSSCPYNAQNRDKLSKIPVQANIIKELWTNKASVRHYIAYLELSKNRLFNTWFDPKEQGINDRTIRELCNLSTNLTREKKKGLVYITNSAEGNVYHLPMQFLDQEAHVMLGEHLKHYLMILIKGYIKGRGVKNDKYINLNVSISKIKNDLGYNDVSSVYKLIKKLKKLGFLIVKNSKLVALYYTSYKVKEIQEYREEREQRIAKVNTYNAAVGSMVVNGIQLEQLTISKTLRTIEINRGSPG